MANVLRSWAGMTPSTLHNSHQMSLQELSPVQSTLGLAACTAHINPGIMAWHSGPSGRGGFLIFPQ